MDGTTAATIPIRDVNGRMQAADPASGATDKTLTTANWVSQTGSGRPNNLIHESGDEDVNGIKTNTYNASTSSAGALNPKGYVTKMRNLDTSTVLASGNRYFFMPMVIDANDKIIAGIRIQVASSSGGRLIFTLATTGTDGNLSLKQLGVFNQSTNTWDP